MTIAFVSSPYSHPDFLIRDARAEIVGDFCAWLWQEKIGVPFSPIAHWHHICQRNNLPDDAASWERLNRAFVRQADILYVLCIPGWEQSVGVRMEIGWARQHGVTVCYATPSGAGYIFSEMPSIDCAAI